MRGAFGMRMIMTLLFILRLIGVLKLIRIGMGGSPINLLLIYYPSKFLNFHFSIYQFLTLLIIL
jgi:hypothetical protein